MLNWIISHETTEVVHQTLDRQTVDTTNPGQTNDGHKKH